MLGSTRETIYGKNTTSSALTISSQIALFHPLHPCTYNRLNLRLLQAMP